MHFVANNPHVIGTHKNRTRATLEAIHAMKPIPLYRQTIGRVFKSTWYMSQDVDTFWIDLHSRDRGEYSMFIHASTGELKWNARYLGNLKDAKTFAGQCLLTWVTKGPKAMPKGKYFTHDDIQE